MKVGDLVKLDPDSAVITDMYIDDPEEYKAELKWVGIVTAIETDYDDHTEIVMVQWSHQSHTCPEYVDYLMLVEEPDTICP